MVILPYFPTVGHKRITEAWAYPNVHGNLWLDNLDVLDAIEHQLKRIKPVSTNLSVSNL